MKKGFSLVALVAAVVIMLIFISVITVSGSNMARSRKLSSFATEINTVQKAVDTYLNTNSNDYPILESVQINLSSLASDSKVQFTDNGDTISNNTITLYKIDYDKIGVTDLEYGNYSYGENDVYLLSAVTSKVYYVKGFKVGSKVYYTITDEVKKAISYKTTDSVTSDTVSDVITYKKEALENGSIKVTVKVPVAYTNPIVKLGTTTISGTSSNGFYTYNITTTAGNKINISYTYNGSNKSTTYTVE